MKGSEATDKFNKEGGTMGSDFVVFFNDLK
jgi:hypothetical protein